VSIVPILTDVIEWMKTDWRCRDMRFYLSISTKLNPDDCNVQCYRVEIEQIIINLIINAASAIRSMEVPRQMSDDLDIMVNLNLIHSNRSLEITVSDRGPGVSDALLETIFTSFTTTRSDGLGLGLSISKSIANELGGTLKYKTRYGGGAQFILSLPVAPSNQLDSNYALL
jgi:C4-dicarboxylate-specific signal transduction histidine kinase